LAARAGSGDPVTWLVTGASGFLGRHLLQALQSDPAPRRALALVRDRGAWARADWTRKLDRVELVEGSVTDAEAWGDDPRLADVRGVFHLAALVRHSRTGAAEVERTNVEGAAAMVRLAAARGWRVVAVSTSGTVGCFDSERESADEDAAYCESAVRRWPYYRSKLEAERRARRLADALGAELSIVRPPVLLGPGDHRYRSTSHLLRYLRRRLPFLVRGGVHFADVRDVARALVRVMELEALRPVYHLPGTACSVERFFGLAEEICGVPAPRVVLPYPVAWGLARALAPLHVLPDPVVVEMASRWWGLHSRFAEADLGYASRDPRRTLADSIEWLRQNHPALIS
jgi:nucleoside-diphosphate-sugar epimerase